MTASAPSKKKPTSPSRARRPDFISAAPPRLMYGSQLSSVTMTAKSASTPSGRGYSLLIFSTSDRE